MVAFIVNPQRYSPYASYRFLVYFGNATSPVAAVSKVGTLKRSTDVIEFKEGGDQIIRKSNGRTKYEPITIERGLTADADFANWANTTQVLDNSSPGTSLANLRQEVRIDFLDEQGNVAYRFMVHRAWVSEYQALPDLDAGANAIAIEHIKMENEGWESIPVPEPKET